MFELTFQYDPDQQGRLQQPTDADQARDTVLNRFKATDPILDLRIRTAVRIRDMLPSL